MSDLFPARFDAKARRFLRLAGHDRSWLPQLLPAGKVYGMLDEAALRTTAFDEGPRVRLADGQLMALPARLADGDDPVYGALLEGVVEAEDPEEQLRGELALTIALLARNYRLSAQDYQQLLVFPAGDECLAALQQVVHELTLD